MVQFTWWRTHNYDNTLLNYSEMRFVTDEGFREIQNFRLIKQCPPTRKSSRFLDNVENYGRSRQTTDDIVRNCMPFACCFTKATRTHSEHVIHIFLKAKVVLRKRINITSHALFLPCLTLLYSQFILCVVSLLGMNVSRGITDSIFSSGIC